MAYGEVDLMRIEEFIAVTKQFETHYKNYPDVENHCDTCRWVRPRLEALRTKTAEYAEMRKTDDDKIDWNVLILELLNEDTQADEINDESPPKRARMESKPAEPIKKEGEEEGIGSKLEKLMAEKKAKEEADEIYNFEMDSFDDDEPEDSGEDQEDEEQEEEDHDEDDAMEGTSEQGKSPAEPQEESTQKAADKPAEEAKNDQENEPKVEGFF